MRLPRKAILMALVTSLIVQGVSAPPLRAEHWYHHWLKHSLHRVKPPTTKEPTVECLAQEIDYLEHHIDTFGTVVAKHPDVWGQARLTKYRQEYEREMAKQVGEFKDTLQGAIRRSDQAYLGMALALDSAANGASTTVSNNTALNMISPLPGGDPITRTAPGKPDLSDFASKSIALEPTVHIDQMSRYLNHLQELRRINEGDDTADSPGYALNLVRIPISITPGKMTRKGYGAEITITAEPYLSEDLLPVTFRNLVINDLIDVLSLGLTKSLENKELLAKANSLKTDVKNAKMNARNEQKAAQEVYPFLRSVDATTPLKDLVAGNAVKELINRVSTEDSPGVARALKAIESAKSQPVKKDEKIDKEPEKVSPEVLDAINTIGTLAENLAAGQALQFKQMHPDFFGDNFTIDPRASVSDLANLFANGTFAVAPKFEKLAQVQSVSRSRVSLLPFPSSEIVDVFGDTCLTPLFITAHDNVPRNDGKHIHILDVEAFLQGELNAAYEFLKTPEGTELWSHCSPGLVRAIRARLREPELPSTGGQISGLAELPDKAEQIATPRDYQFTIRSLRDAFFQDVARAIPQATNTATASLAWAIIVESALLNQRLIEDMAQVSSLKGCDCQPGIPGEGCLEFFLPNPSPEARAQFNRYVACRWPIQVFALDPNTDDQNIADIFSRRREMQLALAVGVAQGNVRANAAMRFMRRMELDMETIALNRTAVGFVHGSDTFGWRFYPRVQSPETPGTIVAFGQTLFGGPSRDHDLLDRQLEPAMRECVAIVVMPSFVPYVKFESRANWFCLTHPRKLELTMHEAMKLSRTYQGVCNQLPCVRDSGSYRAGDVGRLAKVIDQLDRKLPLQSMMVQIPFENELGGFEIFSTGVSDLGPELRGWFGEPGIFVNSKFTCPSGTDAGIDLAGANQCQNTCVGTTMFLVGNHFSVHDTKVIAGGKCVPFDLISRQIMRVVIPPNVQTFKNENKEEMVDVHAATPYGVTSHLLIPAISPAEEPKKPTSGWNWSDLPSLEATVCFGNCQSRFCLSDANKPITIAAADKKAMVPPNAKLTMRLSAVDAKDTARVLGDIANIPVTLKGGTADVPWSDLKAKMTDVVNAKTTDVVNAATGLKQTDNAVKVVGTAILEFDVQDTNLPPMPSVKLDDPLVITLKSPNDCKDCGSAGTPSPATPAPKPAADSGSSTPARPAILRFPEQPAAYRQSISSGNQSFKRLPPITTSR